ncbi:MAG TPA: hypothetical protein VFV02_00735 [Acidimicrobiales bacterium]|nr:hypothetical protein [Acidimicrobiales bacterium]
MSPIFRNFRDASQSRVGQHGFDRYLFFGRADEVVEGPQAYMNELDPGVELAAHFHKVDQFQVFFGGMEGARFLRHNIPDVMVHYTDAYSTYGPFTSGREEKLLYATLRAEHSNFGGVMPGARAELPYRGRRNLESDVGEWAVKNAPRIGQLHREVIHCENDGMGCTLTLAGPGVPVRVDRKTTISGRFYCVLDGDLVVGTQRYERLALGWESGDDEPAGLVAGDTGCSLLTVDFPHPPTSLREEAPSG